MIKLMHLIALTLTLTPCFGQSKTWLANTLRTADTVWLIRHDNLRNVYKDSSGHSPQTNGEVRVVTAADLDPKKSLPEANRLSEKDGLLNPAILRQQKVLPGFLLDSLVYILTATYEYDKVEESLCFDPHQAIVWCKNGTISYIDCCFHCLRFVASSDLKELQGKNFGVVKWAALRDFFDRQGLMGK